MFAKISKRPQLNQAAFTLVEIMIVVAIIALLAALAVPGFLRSRKRSQATVVLTDCRVLDHALAMYATDNTKLGTTVTRAAMLTTYLKPGTRMYNQAKLDYALTDIFGNVYQSPTLDSGFQVNTATIALFTDVIDNSSSFWGAYMPQ